MQTGIRWTTADLSIFEGDRSNRYEIIDGELFVTRAPDWKHQRTCVNIGAVLKDWSDQSGLGETAVARSGRSSFGGDPLPIG
jgi:Uma2 family endonuclease